MATRASARIVNHAAVVGKHAFAAKILHQPFCLCSARCLSATSQLTQNTGERLFLKSKTKKTLSTNYEFSRQSVVSVSGLLYAQQSRQHSNASYLSVEDVEEIGGDKEEGSFDKYGISETVQRKLRARGINSLFPVQYKAYEHSMAGNDVIIQARTGTGKTLSFAIPLVEKLLQEETKYRYGRNPKVMVLTPTRELANQVRDDFQKLSDDVVVIGVYGGVPYRQQIRQLRSGLDVIVGTPGRMNDLIQQGVLRLDDVKHVVLDEVDSMLDFGFKEQVETIISQCYGKATKPQTMLYSATMPSWVIDTAKKYLSDNYQFLNFVSDASVKTATTIEQYAIECSPSEHEVLIQNLLNQFTGSEGRAIVFCEMKRQVDRLAHGMLSKISRGLHGDRSQADRENILKGFKEHKFRILITTSVAARGLDIPDVPLVIQTSPPNNTDDYIHRVGRTGRAGKSGVAICFYEPGQRRSIFELERIANKKFKKLTKPSEGDVLELALKNSVERLSSVPEDVIDLCKDAADKYIQEKGSTEALAAAFAVIGNLEKVYNRSLISGQSGFRTLQFKSEFGDTTIKYMKELLFDIVDDSIIGDIVYTKARKAVVFDVKANQVSQLVRELEAREGLGTVEILRELPDLETSEKVQFFDNRFGGNDRSDYRSRGFGHKRSSMSDRYRSSRDDISRHRRPGHFDKFTCRHEFRGPHEFRGQEEFRGHRDSFMRRPRSFDEDYES